MWKFTKWVDYRKKSSLHVENVWSAMINNKIQFNWTNPKTYFLVCLPTYPVICLLTFACYEKINWKSRKSYACLSTLFSFLTDQRVCFYICLLWFTMNHDLGVKYVGQVTVSQAQWRLFYKKNRNVSDWENIVYCLLYFFIVNIKTCECKISNQQVYYIIPMY